MTEQVVAARIQTLYATAAELADANPILLEGEWGTEKDTGKRKIGDGMTAWNDLDYWDASASSPNFPIGTLSPVNNSLLYYDANLQLFQADDTQTVLSIVDGGNF